MTKNANFGPNLVVLGQEILIFTGESKSFGTHIMEKPPRHLVCIFLVGHGTKWARNTNIWPKVTKNAYFGPIRSGGSRSFGINYVVWRRVQLHSKLNIGRYRNSNLPTSCLVWFYQEITSNSMMLNCTIFHRSFTNVHFNFQIDFCHFINDLMFKLID